MKIEYGDGKLQTQSAMCGEFPCLVISKQTTTRPVGSVPKAWETEVYEESCDVLIVFKTLEGARVLQDELNGLISAWSKQLAPVVD